MIVEAMIYIYLAICGGMIVFNLVCVNIYRKKDDVTTRRDKRFFEEVKTYVTRCHNGEMLSSREIDRISRKCKHVWLFSTLDQALQEMTDEDPEVGKEFLRQISRVFLELSFIMDKKSTIQQAHFAYFLKKYDIVRNAPSPIMLNYLSGLAQVPNLYCRENALQALYTTGDPYLVSDAIIDVSQAGFFHHEKLLVEGLLSFRGDRDELITLLLRRRKECSLELQRIILRFVFLGSRHFQKEMLEIMLDDREDDEQRFTAIRYFGKCPLEDAYPTLCSFAENRDERRWEYAAIAVSSLSSYPREYTVNILKKSLSAYNWYIRANAAVSLEKFHLSYLELADILDSNDRYAREILQYRMDLDRQKEN